MLYICVPSHNESPTIGVLLWRIRKVFQEYSREYEVLVFDDASTDGTRDTIAPYAKVMPVTILGGEQRTGYAGAVDALLRAASTRTRYPRRDAVVLMQGDFTDQPEHLPELVKRFEGGADVVVSERIMDAATPAPVRKLAQLSKWLPALWPARAFVRVPGVKDPFGGFRLIRVSVVREMLEAGASPARAALPVCAVNVELTHAAVRAARRVESVPLAPRWDLRPRESRVRPWADAFDIVRHGWSARSRRTTAA